MLISFKKSSTDTLRKKMFKSRYSVAGWHIKLASIQGKVACTQKWNQSIETAPQSIEMNR